MRLLDAHVLITGASRGIGAQIATHAAARGARLTLVARASDALASTAVAVGGRSLAADLGDPGQVRGLVAAAEAEQGPVTVLVNAAGVDAVGSSLSLAQDDLARLLAVNLAAPAELCRQVLPGMVTRAAGQVVNVSSGFSTLIAPGLTSYCATKAGLSHLTAGLQAELRGTGVSTTLVELGPVRTTLYEGILEDRLAGPALRRFLRLRGTRAVEPSAVAIAVCDAIETGAAHVVLPRRMIPVMGLTWAPRRVAEVLLTGTPRR